MNEMGETDEDMVGLLTPQRIEAIVNNLMDKDTGVDGWIAYIDELQRFPPLPDAVTVINWPDLERAGWQWLTNVSNNTRGDAIIEGVRNRHSAQNVLVGWSWNGSMPIKDSNRSQIGVYVLEILDMI